MGRIDVHQHVFPPGYVEAIGPDAIGSLGSSGRMPPWDLDESVALMDSAGIDAAAISISAPGLAGLTRQHAADLARSCNEFMADASRGRPGRFATLAAVPLESVDDSLEEVAYAFDTLAMDGVGLLSNYRGMYLGDPAMDHFYEELDRRSSVVFVHPTTPTDPAPVAGTSVSLLDFPFDTTRTIVSLLFGGVITRYPSIRWIFAHAGGTLPYLAGRLEVLVRNNQRLAEAVGDDIVSALRTLHFDVALSADRAHLDALRALVPNTRILFGSDYPFGPPEQMLDTGQRLDRLELDDRARTAINSENAERLFPRLSPTSRNAGVNAQ